MHFSPSPYSRVLVKGWSFDGDPPPDSPGLWRRGQMEDSDSQSPLDGQRDWVLRKTMADARSALCAAHQRQHENLHHQSQRPTGSRGTTPVVRPLGKGQNLSNEMMPHGSSVLELKRDKGVFIKYPLGLADRLQHKANKRCKNQLPHKLLPFPWPQKIQFAAGCPSLQAAALTVQTQNPESVLAGLADAGNRTFLRSFPKPPEPSKPQAKIKIGPSTNNTTSSI